MKITESSTYKYTVLYSDSSHDSVVGEYDSPEGASSAVKSYLNRRPDKEDNLRIEITEYDHDGPGKHRIQRVPYWSGAIDGLENIDNLGKSKKLKEATNDSLSNSELVNKKFNLI